MILVNPSVVQHASSGGSGFSYLKMMVGNTPPSNYFSIPAEHLGLMSIKAYAEARGLRVDVVNGVVDEHVNMEQTLAAIESTVERVGPPALIGFSQILAFAQNIWLTRECKRRWPDAVVVFGHDFATLNWQRILQEYPEVDYVSVGEGEAVYEQLARCVLNNRSVEHISGLAYRDSRGTPVLVPPETIDLDTLPWPSRDELPQVRRLGFSPAVFASRGCPYRCAFCTTGQATRVVGQGGYRYKSVEVIVDEMVYLWRKHGCDFINISDDLFITPSHGSRQRAEAFARELLRQGYGGKFMLDARVDSIDPDLFRFLQQAGMSRVFIGVESGSADFLSELDKDYVLRGKSIESRLRSIVDLGVEVIPGIISFHPTVKPAELRATLQVMEYTNFNAPNMLMSPVIVFPGTSLHERYKKAGYLTEEWPIGFWRFADKRAEKAYRDIAKVVQRSMDKEFGDTARQIRGILDEWEMDQSREDVSHGLNVVVS